MLISFVSIYDDFGDIGGVTGIPEIIVDGDQLGDETQDAGSVLETSWFGTKQNPTVEADRQNAHVPAVPVTIFVIRSSGHQSEAFSQGF